MYTIAQTCTNCLDIYAFAAIYTIAPIHTCEKHTKLLPVYKIVTTYNHSLSNELP